MKKILIILFIGIFSLSLTSASISELEPVVQNEPIDLIQTCSDCTFNNITNVLFPNGTIALGESLMEKDGTFYNFTFTNTATIGTYTVNGLGDPEGVLKVFKYKFPVTPFGTQIENSGVIYGVLLLIFFFMDLIVFYIISRLNNENFRNDEGIFVGISIQKYLRVILIGISYGLIVVTLNLMNATATTSSQISQFSGIIGGIYLAMLSAAWVWTIIIVIWLAVMAWKDADFVNQMKKKLKELEEMH